jgi:hypothetical protein
MAIRRVGLRKKSGPKPKSCHYKADRAREALIGIDTDAYLKASPYSLAEECKIDRPGTIVQEDRARTHSSLLTRDL